MCSRVATNVCVFVAGISLISLRLAVPREVVATVLVGWRRARGRGLVSAELEGGGVVVWRGERGRRVEPVGRVKVMGMVWGGEVLWLVTGLRCERVGMRVGMRVPVGRQVMGVGRVVVARRSSCRDGGSCRWMVKVVWELFC
jgi:hypothetical protein